MPLTLAAIERIKLAATACNTMGTALVTVGIFTPLAYRATTMEVLSTERLIFLYAVMGICIIAALTLHCTGQAILILLEKHDDKQ